MNLNSTLCLYKYRNYLKHVSVLYNGAIVIGKNFTIDGFSERPIRVITHAHSDHLNGIEESIRFSKYIIATPITLDLIEALSYINRDLIPLLRAKNLSLNYHQAFSFENEEIEFYNADHIPGSAQVQIKIKNNKPPITAGYTGDFKLTSKTEIMEDLNVLVIEATYGNPLQTRPFKESVPQLLVDLVFEGLLKYRRIYIYAYHGKMQEAMSILRDHGVNTPFILPDKVYKATKLLEEKHGFSYGQYHKENTILNSKEKAIVFKHFNTARSRRLDGSSLHIVLTGRLTTEPYMRVDDYTYVVSLSDHADFIDLVRYVEYSNPELVIVDGSRPGDSETLKSFLLERGFCTTVLPGDVST